MIVIALTFEYFKWHYGAAVANLFRIAGDFFRFLYHFFSIPIMVGTLFSPWRRIHEAVTDPFDAEAVLTSVVVNGLMRLVGFFVRLTMLFFFLICWVLLAGLTLLALAAWLVWPLLIFGLFISGLSYLWP